MQERLNWINSPASVLIFNIVILILVILNLNYQLLVFQQEKENQIIERENTTILSNIEDLQDGADYQSTDLFKDKNAKLQGYKKKGEVIIDTSLAEPVLNDSIENKSYIPELDSLNQSPIQNWYQCIFGSDLIKKIEADFCTIN
jgi:cell division protein FtsB